MIFISAVQLKGQSGLDYNASYLDPIVIDLLAFALSAFLIIEGAYRIWEHKNNSYKKQVTRSIRIAFGFGILTTHIIQSLYKVVGLRLHP